MRRTNWLILVMAAALFVSCGNNSTKDASTRTDTTTDGTNGTALNNNNNGGNMNNGSVNSGNDTVPPVNGTGNMGLNVPDPTRQAFQSKYPTASNVNWRRYEPYDEIEWSWAGWPNLDTTAYVVTYTDNGTEYNAWYDRNNNWVGTVSNLSDESNVPQPVRSVLDKSYSGYTVTSMSRENDKNRTAYEVKLENGDKKVKVLVDENGNILKKVTSTDGLKTKEKNQ
jgi:hypothetical protein